MTGHNEHPEGTNASRIGQLGLAAHNPRAFYQHEDSHALPIGCLHRHDREADKSLAHGIRLLDSLSGLVILSIFDCYKTQAQD